MFWLGIEGKDVSGINFTHIDKALNKFLKIDISEEDDLSDLGELEKQIKRLEFINNHLMLLIRLSNVKENKEKLISKFSFEIVSFFIFRYLDEAHYGKPYTYDTDVDLIKDICIFAGYKSDVNIQSKKAAFSVAIDELIDLKIIVRENEDIEDERIYRLKSFLKLEKRYFD